MKYPRCNCGGLKVDHDTLKVNEANGELYAAGVVTSDNVNVDDIIDAVRKQVPMSSLPENGHTLLGTEVFDEAIEHINERFDTDELSLQALDIGIKNVIKGDHLDIRNTALLELNRSEQGVVIDGQGLDAVELKTNKDVTGGYLGIDEQGKVHRGVLTFSI